MPRYFVLENQITENEIFIEGEDAKHIGTVLRSRIGDKIEVSNTNGFDYFCEITAIEKNKVTLEINEKKLNQTEPKTKITLYQGLPKSDKMELIIQKCVEIGVCKIVPVETERAVVKIKDNDKKISRWQKISQSAAMQSGRGIVPEIGNVISFKNAVDNFEGSGIIPFELEKERSIREFVQGSNSNEISIFIGPEGGFSHNEIEYATSKGVLPITLGKRILRTETAGIVTISILLYELG